MTTRHALFPILMIIAATLMIAGCGPMTLVVGITPGDQELTSTAVIPDGRLGSDKVAVIDVSGIIINADRPGLIRNGENPLSLFHEKLRKAENDDRVKAIILRLNTPGGAVTASDAMYRDVIRFKTKTKKPVVALMMDVTASGGYYLACSADHIVAYPTCVTGSIGVIVQTISVKPALAKIGVHTEAITSGPNKDAGSPLSTLSDEHRRIFNDLVDDFYNRFVNVVRTNRPDIHPDRLAELTDGRVISGDDAAAVGLADQTGDLYTAFESARSLAGIKKADLILYHRPLIHVGSPYAAAPAATPETTNTTINLAQINLTGHALAGSDSPAVFYYLWCPEIP